MANVKDVFSIEALDEQIERGFVSKRKHPDLPLYIYNYTQEATFANEWNEVTMTCRGLILDGDYNIIARPFRKFFNLETAGLPETQINNLPRDVKQTITEKMDGSLGILWRYKGHEGIATRGSFTSEQAIWATNHWRTLMFLRWHFAFDRDTTPLFEIIYPENRIVVDYKGDKKLVLLGIVNNADGTEYSYDELKSTGYPNVVTVYEGKSLSDCVSQAETDLPLNREGYVVSYDTKPMPLRIKIKFDEYLRLHRLIFSLNDRVIWESVSQGINPNANLDYAPDEIRAWIKKYTQKFLSECERIAYTAEDVFNRRPRNVSRKEIAQWFSMYPEVKSSCFAMLDNKDYFPIIWKMLRPKHATPFRRDVPDGE
jgi:RNA ligase